MNKQRFVILVEREGPIPQRAFGVYRSFKQAEGDAKAWRGVVLPLEPQGSGSELAVGMWGRSYGSPWEQFVPWRLVNWDWTRSYRRPKP